MGKSRLRNIGPEQEADPTSEQEHRFSGSLFALLLNLIDMEELFTIIKLKL